MLSTIRLQGKGFIYSEGLPDDYQLPLFFYDPEEPPPRAHPLRAHLTPGQAVLALGLLSISFAIIAIVRLL